MGHPQYDPAMQARPAWNTGKMVGTKRPLTQKQIWTVRFFLECEGRLRDRALFDLAIDSKLRGGDLVKIKIGDLVSGADIRSRPARVDGCRHSFERGSLSGWRHALASALPQRIAAESLIINGTHP
jgi:hypothetical protein